MIEKDKIKWIEDENSKGGGDIWYKDVKLDLSLEIIQSIYHGSMTEEELDKSISDAYEKCLRLQREKILKNILNDKDGN
jgi:hypothetical protein